MGRGRRRRGEVKAGSDMGSGVSFGGFEREGELGSGLALPQDDFLLLFLLPLTVLLKLHTLLVNLSLLLHNSQLLLSQFGLSFCDLAVILLQDFFQLLPLRFFFLLDGQHGAMLAHERATATEPLYTLTHKPLIVWHTHFYWLYRHSQTSQTHSLHHREVCSAFRTCGILHSHPELV